MGSLPQYPHPTRGSPSKRLHTLPSGSLNVPSEAPRGLPLPPDASVNPLLYLCQLSLVLSKILICLLLHHFHPSISHLLISVSDQICGRNIFHLPGDGASYQPQGCPNWLYILDSIMPPLQTSVSLIRRTKSLPFSICEAGQLLPHPWPHQAQPPWP